MRRRCWGRILRRRGEVGDDRGSAWGHGTEALTKLFGRTTDQSLALLMGWSAAFIEPAAGAAFHLSEPSSKVESDAFCAPP
jgi:hypothetical protein